MRWLITGGAGFIGSHLAELLISRNQDVYVVDDLSTGDIRNLALLEKHSRFQFFYSIFSINFEVLSIDFSYSLSLEQRIWQSIT